MATMIQQPITALPDKEALIKCFETATIPDVADYMVVQLDKLLKRAGSEIYNNSQSLLDKFKEFAQNVHLQYEKKADPWRGDVSKVRTDFQNLQHNLAETAMETIQSSVGGFIKMDYAIGDDGSFLRGYSTYEGMGDDQIDAIHQLLNTAEDNLLDENSTDELNALLTDANGEPIEALPLYDDQVQALDKLFNAWLAERNLISKDSVIYEANSNGEILKDRNGNSLRAKGDKIRALIRDPDQGFYNLLKGKGIQLNTQQHVYPSAEKKAAATTQPAQQPQARVPAAAQQAAKAEAEAVKPEQQAPHKGGGM